MDHCPLFPELWKAHILPACSPFSQSVLRATCRRLCKDAGELPKDEADVTESFVHEMNVSLMDLVTEDFTKRMLKRLGGEIALGEWSQCVPCHEAESVLTRLRQWGCLTRVDYWHRLIQGKRMDIILLPVMVERFYTMNDDDRVGVIVKAIGHSDDMAKMAVTLLSLDPKKRNVGIKYLMKNVILQNFGKRDRQAHTLTRLYHWKIIGRDDFPHMLLSGRFDSANYRLISWMCSVDPSVDKKETLAKIRDHATQKASVTHAVDMCDPPKLCWCNGCLLLYFVEQMEKGL
jgi:hypothetical protein